MRLKALLTAAAVMATTLVFGTAGAGSAPAGPPDHSAAFDYWTAERVASAQPRDLVIGENGRGYRLGANGALIPHGHNVVAPQRALNNEGHITQH